MGWEIRRRTAEEGCGQEESRRWREGGVVVGGGGRRSEKRMGGERGRCRRGEGQVEFTAWERGRCGGRKEPGTARELQVKKEKKKRGHWVESSLGLRRREPVERNAGDRLDGNHGSEGSRCFRPATPVLWVDAAPRIAAAAQCAMQFNACLLPQTKWNPHRPRGKVKNGQPYDACCQPTSPAPRSGISSWAFPVSSQLLHATSAASRLGM